MPRTDDSESKTKQQPTCSHCGGPLRSPPGEQSHEEAICGNCDGVAKSAYHDQLERVTDTDV